MLVCSSETHKRVSDLLSGTAAQNSSNENGAAELEAGETKWEKRLAVIFVAQGLKHPSTGSVSYLCFGKVGFG